MDIREQAYRLFQDVLLPAYEEEISGSWSVTPETEEERNAYRVLLSVGLVQFYGTRDFQLTEHGLRACAGRVDIRPLLGLAPPPEAAPPHIINIAAMNTAPGGSAVGTIHGNVNVGQVDEALHKLVELQDELGEDAETLWKLLRRVRALELQGEATAAILEDLEVRAFVEDVQPDTREHALKVLGMVPDLLKVAAAVCG